MFTFGTIIGLISVLCIYLYLYTVNKAILQWGEIISKSDYRPSVNDLFGEQIFAIRECNIFQMEKIISCPVRVDSFQKGHKGSIQKAKNLLRREMALFF